jgi:hypothetical protein
MKASDRVAGSQCAHRTPSESQHKWLTPFAVVCYVVVHKTSLCFTNRGFLADRVGLSLGVRGFHMNASKRNSFCRAAVMTALLATMLVCQASAGGPICAPPPSCMPPMCAPQPCAPPPLCGPPPMCAPRMCGPKPCPPPVCEDNPLAMILKGTCRLVAGVVALPFKIVGCLLNSNSPCAKPACYPRPVCPPMAMCPPPMCPPPMCMPQGCGMGCCPPGMGYGMGAMAPSFGYGRGVPRQMMKPMAKKEKKSLPQQLLAGPSDGLFGAYW